MKTGFLITARMKSTRLPKKLTLKILDREIIRWMIDRLKLNTNINAIVICTSVNPQDDILVQIAEQEGIEAYRGSEDDVLERLHGATEEYQFDFIVNITADCPLISYKYIDNIIDKYQETGADFIQALDLPHGFFSYGIAPKALRKVCEIKDSVNTEVWGRYFTESGIFSVVNLDIPHTLKRANYRLTLDYPEDFEFFKRVFKHFGKNTYKQSIEEIIEFLDQYPEVVEINSQCDEKYKKRWDLQNKLQLK